MPYIIITYDFDEEETYKVDNFRESMIRMKKYSDRWDENGSSLPRNTLLSENKTAVQVVADLKEIARSLNLFVHRYFCAEADDIHSYSYE